IVTSLACSSLLSLSPFLFKWFCSNRDLHSFPTRRSSDLYHGSCSTAAVVGKINRSVPCDFYVAVQSAALHGHVKVARDGTVYLPNNSCGGTGAVVEIGRASCRERV